ncbi:hypothetical protein [Nocardia sp. NPDC058666]|uniref:hypothetical protein n=1 Tax=unclassified Nocardia TaxID=2637762 RepID=UPI00365A5B05
MATQQSTVRATLPAPATATVALPSGGVSRSSLPTPPRQLLQAEVPIIKPYSVSQYSGSGGLVARLDSARSTAPAQLTASATTVVSTSPRGSAQIGPVGAGRVTAKVVVKSGKVLARADFSGDGDSVATRNTHLFNDFASAGTTSVIFNVISGAEAWFGSEGRLSGLKPFGIAVGGSGQLAVDTAVAGSVIVAGGTTGAGALSAITGQVNTLRGTGTLSVAQGLPAMTGGQGSLSVSVMPKSQVSLPSTGNGQLSLDTQQSFAPSRMTKSPAWNQLPNTFVVVPGWVADTANYPGSVVNSDGVIAQAPKSGATLAASIVFTAPGGISGDVTLRLTVNNVVVATGVATSVPSSGSATANVSVVRAISMGDIVRVEAKGTQFSPTFNPTAQINTASYVRIT